MEPLKKGIKKLIILFCLFLFHGEFYAQCIADAGPDRIRCMGDKSVMQLGGTPTANGGEAPYTYRWSCNDFAWDTLYTASHYLDDTTLANPSLPNGMGLNLLTFKVEVTDANGAVCEDEVVLKSSMFLWTMDVKRKDIAQGDSVRLYLSITGGIPPYRYQWSPGHSLDDSTLRYPYASPDTTTDYTLLLTDSAGCQGIDGFLVVVFPLSTSEIETSSLKVYPNPAGENMTFSLNAVDHYTLQLFDSHGKPVYTASETGSNFNIDTHSFEKGVYFYRIQGENRGNMHSGKIVLE